MHRSICDFALDVIQNSIEASSDLIVVDFIESDEDVVVFVADNGPGMSAEVLEKVKDPFFTDGKKHAHRSAGLGLPFLAQAIELSGGSFEIDSREGMGTSVQFRFSKEDIDSPPVGAVDITFFAALTFPGDHEMVINRTDSTKVPTSSYSLSRSELSEACGGLETSGALVLLRRFVRSLEEKTGKRSEEATDSFKN
jgi:histidine kinase/DNA gyrase B/HSP90-like ATPase